MHVYMPLKALGKSNIIFRCLDSRSIRRPNVSVTIGYNSSNNLTHTDVRAEKLPVYNEWMREINGFVPTINGSLSRFLNARARRLGISDRTYDAEAKTDDGVGGEPYPRSVLNGTGRGGRLS